MYNILKLDVNYTNDVEGQVTEKPKKWYHLLPSNSTRVLLSINRKKYVKKKLNLQENMWSNNGEMFYSHSSWWPLSTNWSILTAVKNICNRSYNYKDNFADSFLLKTKLLVHFQDWNSRISGNKTACSLVAFQQSNIYLSPYSVS